MATFAACLTSSQDIEVACASYSLVAHGAEECARMPVEKGYQGVPASFGAPKENTEFALGFPFIR